MEQGTQGPASSPSEVEATTAQAAEATASPARRRSRSPGPAATASNCSAPSARLRNSKRRSKKPAERLGTGRAWPSRGSVAPLSAFLHQVYITTIIVRWIGRSRCSSLHRHARLPIMDGERQCQAAAEERQDCPEATAHIIAHGELAGRGEEGRYRRLRGRRRRPRRPPRRSDAPALPRRRPQQALARHRRGPRPARRRWRSPRGAQGLASLGLASAFANLVAKPLTTRRRPEREELEVLARRHVPMPRSSSFPSGHAASAFAFATGAGNAQPALSAPLRALATLVGYSRVHTGVHYPADVLAGAFIGVSAAEVAGRPAPRIVSLTHPGDTLSSTGTALPRISGLTIGGAFGSRPRSSSLHLEAGGGDRRDRVAVAVAAVAEEAPGLLEPVLPARQARVLGADVLDEEQLAAGPQHPRRLGQRRPRVGDRAEDQGRDRGVEAVVVEAAVARPALRSTLRRRAGPAQLAPAAAWPCAGRARPATSSSTAGG